jgi:hypothetical protein
MLLQSSGCRLVIRSAPRIWRRFVSGWAPVPVDASVRQPIQIRMFGAQFSRTSVLSPRGPESAIGAHSMLLRVRSPLTVRDDRYCLAVAASGQILVTAHKGSRAARRFRPYDMAHVSPGQAVTHQVDLPEPRRHRWRGIPHRRTYRALARAANPAPVIGRHSTAVPAEVSRVSARTHGVTKCIDSGRLSHRSRGLGMGHPGLGRSMAYQSGPRWTRISDRIPGPGQIDLVRIQRHSAVRGESY